MGGFTGGTHTTSHLRDDNQPLGGNVLYRDGRVLWRPFQAMELRSGDFDPQHWF